MVARQEEVPDMRKPTRTGKTVSIPDGYLTREDVRLLRIYFAAMDEEQNAAYASLAARIEALLPPDASKRRGE